MGTPIRGFNGVIEVGPTPENVGEIRRWEYTREGDEEDSSVMGTTRTEVTNIKVRGTMEVYAQQWPGTDPAQDPGQALFVVNTVLAATLYPNGVGSGKPQLAGNIKITSEAVTAEHDGLIGATFAYELDGADDWTRSAQT